MTTTEPAEMKPCPFCGGEPHLGYGSPGCWFVSCSKCKAMSDDRGRDAAILLWNTRTPPAAPADDAVEALALLFHNTYERLAPEYGYSTRHDTRIFDAKSANGRLVLAVCKEVLEKGYTLRRETMTEAELEREAEELIALIMRKKPLYTTGGKTGPLVDDVEDFDVYVDADEAKATAMGLAKKYRG